MRKGRLYLFIVILFPALFCVLPSAAQTQNGASFSPDSFPGRHRGEVTDIRLDANGRILSVGEDGFLEIWNNRSAEERFQLSPYSIKSMALRPGRPQIAIVENDGLSLYRISVWNYETRENLFTLRFRDSVSYINYSAMGSFLIVARSGRTGAAFIHADTGEVLESPEELSGPITLAATGRSERIMISYLSLGVLSYWDLESGNEIQNLEVPVNIRSPVLFGNNRYLGGFDSGGLVVLDAVTGIVIARDESIRDGRFFINSQEGNNPASGSSGAVQFYCLTTTGRTSIVYRMTIDSYGRITTSNRMTVPFEVEEPSAVAAADTDNIILGTRGGNLWLMGRNSARIMDTGNPEMIIEAAASQSAIAFISGKGELGYIPLDYSLLENGSVITLEDASDPYGSGTFTNIVSESSILGRPDTSQFLLWQSGAGRSIPLLKTISGPPNEANSSQLFLDKLSLRFPLRSTAIRGNSLLFLDTSGEVTILDRQSGEPYFNYSASGSVDAAFIDQNSFIIGRTAITGNSPFLTVNISTGETVPLAYPAVVGIRVYQGLSGSIYGAVVNQSAGLTQTSIIRLNTTNPAQSEKLVEYNGEDSYFTLAESGGNLASTLGGSGATLYLSRSQNRNQGASAEIVSLERSMALPVKIFDGGGYWFMVLDGEGGITWHDSRTGKLLAVFRFYSGLWVLERTTFFGSGWETIRGGTAGK